MNPDPSREEEYLRGWRDGYGDGRDDEAAGLPLRNAPPATQQREVRRAPRDRQQPPPGRDR